MNPLFLKVKNKKYSNAILLVKDMLKNVSHIINMRVYTSNYSFMA